MRAEGGRRVEVALDCMGGDEGAAMVLAGAELARERWPDLVFTLFGRAGAVAPALERAPRVRAESALVEVEGEVLGTDPPSQALRRARSTSMGQAIAAVKEGRATAAVSAGNTGALMAIAKVSLRMLDGIDRPALTALMPTSTGEAVVLDLGANTDCSSHNLVEFAIMGAAFARTVLGLARPRVALLNIGEEDMKGTQALKEAQRLLRAAAPGLAMDFRGFVEGNGIHRGEVDVVVTDGFSGNIALKTAEGTAALVSSLLRRAYRASWLTRVGYLFSRSALNAVREQLDPDNHNGAVFLGLNGIVVKSHGGASPRGFANAIGVARELALDDTLGVIRDDLASLHTRPDEALGAA